MNIQVFLVSILSITLCFNIIHSIEANVRCQCSCYFPISQKSHRSIDLPFGSIALENNVCETSLCVDACQRAHPICRFATGTIHGKCIQSVSSTTADASTRNLPAANTTTTTKTTTRTTPTTTTTRKTTTTKPTTTTRTTKTTPKTTHFTISSSTAGPTINSTASVITTTKSAGSSTASAWPATSSQTRKSSTSNGHILKASFQFSHSFMLTIFIMLMNLLK